ncbi:uncharacterized protein PFL1_02530 [Pseudozyma flocculosa PF-1]|uniref:Uncharacterized protein n=2 Tax=Pseudozyma flocculosa TaxID=84751 RepID=A0A5C3EY09_9BASI|nr:uncharacterized protein PFL1_02530 [Pseudozyma flocculosa PF-1]EPQ29857.1 hypothetical protein PFL1_02530 [Pseudozyma flocculosa PF-1]SPO37153.1 uncharacterized protein PSFLO_02625 [Pseudozyma flocculosa]
MASDRLRVPDESGASPSSSSTLPPPTLSLLPSNVASIFLARFDVRSGNQIDFQWPPRPGAATGKLVDTDDGIAADTVGWEGEAVDLTGVEWKVLPSGGHLIERDTIYFQPSTPPPSESSRTRRGQVGVACFRNIKLGTAASAATSSVSAPAPAPAGSGGVDQRGARMISVGLVLSCLSTEAAMSPTAQQLAIVPHLDNLEKLADQLVQRPDQTELLKSYYDAHAVTRSSQGKDQPNAGNGGSSETWMAASTMRQLRIRRRRDPKMLYHDPTSHLPAMCSALGPLLPTILKKLMIRGHRLLIFAPAPPLLQAAYIGYNLADLVTEASPMSRKGGNLVSVRVRGQVGVHDIIALEEEEKQRRTTAVAGEHAAANDDGGVDEAGRAQGTPSWVAWSSDKILLEKPHLFDSVLDLSALASPASGGRLDENSLLSSNACAKLLRVSRTPVQTGGGAPSSSSAAARPPLRERVEAKKQSWTTREFATFNELDAQAERHADRLILLGGRKRSGSGSTSKVKRKASKGSLRRRHDEDRGTAAAAASTLTHRKTRRLDAQGDYGAGDGGGGDAMTRSESALSQWRGGCARSPRRTPGGVLSAILAFLRYWLAGWWFLPTHWRYGLPSSYVLPLGIRGDGGVRSSIMILPISDSDDEDAVDVEDDDEDASSQGSVDGDEDRPDDGETQAASRSNAEESPGKGTGEHQEQDLDGDSKAAAGTALTSSSTESTLSTKTGEDDNDEEDEDDDEGDLDLNLMGPPDPLLAAVGASVPFNHHHHHGDGRKSPGLGRRPSSTGGAIDDDATSAHSNGRGAAAPSRRTVGSVSSGRGYGRRMSFDRFGNHIPLSSSSIRGVDDDVDEADEEIGVDGGHEDWSLLLSDSLWTVWGRWTRALVQGLVEILREERDQALDGAGSGASDGEAQETRRLLEVDGDGGGGGGGSGSGAVVLTVRIGTKEMASLGLSAGNDGDVELVQSLALRVLDKLDRSSERGGRPASSRHQQQRRVTWRVEVDKVWPILRWFL